MINVVEKLVVIGCFCIGINQVDLDVVVKCGILVFNVLFLNMCFVVELVIGELLLLLCGVLEANVKVYCGVRNKLVVGFFEVCGKKLGIIGYGYIGM